jgi:cell division protein FtsQ
VRGGSVLEAPEPEYTLETAHRSEDELPKRTMPREFTDYEEELDDDTPPGRRRQTGVRFKLRGGMPRSRGGKIAVFAGVLALVGVCAAMVWVARNAILHDERFLIPSASSIETIGNVHVSRAELVSLFGEDIERNIFRVPLEERRAELEELPWVEHATVMRLLPNHLRVSVVERTPVAFVRQGNHIGLVDANGVLLEMPAAAQSSEHYSFPVLTGLATKDPMSLRSARMKLYTRFTADLDGGGEKISEKLSEVDLSDPEDVRAVIPDKTGEVTVHFGEDNFLDRYKKFEEHLPVWRQQYPHLASVDMRYERQVVLEMQPGTAAPSNGEQVAPSAPQPAASAVKPAAEKSAGKASSAIQAAAAKKKAAIKPAAKPAKHGPSKPAEKSKGKTGGRAETEPANVPHATAVKATGESFRVHPKKVMMQVRPGSNTTVKYYPAQVVQR